MTTTELKNKIKTDFKTANPEDVLLSSSISSAISILYSESVSDNPDFLKRHLLECTLCSTFLHSASLLNYKK